MPKILIVDDEAHIRLLLEQTLEDFEDYGVEILTAGDGKKAIELILKEKPEIVFLDVMMPDMSGYDVCSKIKNEYRLTNVNIIMLTAKGQGIDEKRGLDAGADMYMTKPFDPDVIVKRASEILNIKF
ncbi:response regulator [Clostridium sp. SYSU_GA19001]|uniref:response regulator transcription factor n=1 Tax=Clostridium caldaquaticum TaxID=2940653 RepID=UPI00207705D7|nr:response regulator [Clostridium caldaquaticum]MCM8709475.1 response regulator [Clostridium caldaquaticum]